MENTDPSIDRLIDEIESCINTVPDLSQTLRQLPLPVEEPPQEPEPQEPEPQKPPKKSPVPRLIGRICAMTGIVVLEILVLAVMGIYCLGYVVAKGPSPSAGKELVMTLRETSAVGFLANLYFTDREIAAMYEAPPEDYEDTDTSLIQFPTKPVEDPTAPTGPQPDAWGLVDEDGDGLIIEQVKGEGYAGFMMVVLDPSRVIMGSHPGSYGSRGYTVAGMAESFGAVAGINAGGFEDEGGSGNGSIPDSLTVFEGKVYYPEKGVGGGFVGIDGNHILHVGKLSQKDIEERGIQYGASFGPVLISNGEVNTAGIRNSGVNPRTAIGQRSDGAMLLLVIDGRQAVSLGATYQDLADIFLRYGAVNACNLDGGSSTLMWHQGEYINNCASVIGIRPVPTTFLVLPLEEQKNG